MIASIVRLQASMKTKSGCGILAVAFVVAVHNEQLMAACGPLAVGTYTVGQSCTPPAGTSADISTQAGTEIDTSAGVSLLSRATNANSTLSLSGTTIDSIPPNLLTAMQAQVLGNAAAGNASIQVNGGANIVNLGGSGLDAIGILNANKGISSFSATTGTTLNIANVVVGNEHDGIDLNASGGGNISVNHDGNGTIRTLGGNGIWAKASGAGNIEVKVGNGVNFIADNSDSLSVGDGVVADENSPQAAAYNHAGIHTRATIGNTTVDNAATLHAVGTNAFGIFTESTTGAMTVHNSGAITANGLNGFGIRSFSTMGDINVVNNGAITTTGGGGHGIYLNDNVGATGSINVENHGALSVGNAADTVGSRAIFVIKRGTGDASVVGTGDITVQGGLDTLRAYGIIMTGESGNLRV